MNGAAQTSATTATGFDAGWKKNSKVPGDHGIRLHSLRLGVLGSKRLLGDSYLFL